MKNSIKNMFALICFGGIACLAMTSTAHLDYTCKQEWKTVLEDKNVQISEKEEGNTQSLSDQDFKLFMSGSLRAFFQ